ncbi:hypothetical protein A6D88_06145 [Klebsiella pneumoniae]|nr:hypothetical protein AOB98_05905 [Klebsiella pneumoniae subsp. pneumoniae]KSW32674.1 hypothetical protein APT67_14530 [Klebsiella pneumoniae]KSW36329.1 hypothetical protein APT66_16470 [Klebsiella pneumoniae]KSW51381.1 hypothetical protein APT70_16065 [Klebsiella pneumoniae]KSW52973.1 hypothetical protein APT68_14130 [Klebsiella pneumoniae]
MLKTSDLDVLVTVYSILAMLCLGWLCLVQVILQLWYLQLLHKSFLDTRQSFLCVLLKLRQEIIPLQGRLHITLLT